MVEYLTTEELAQEMRTSPETVRFWQRTGKAPASIKVGRRRLYARDAVDEWVAATSTDLATA